MKQQHRIASSRRFSNSRAAERAARRRALTCLAYHREKTGRATGVARSVFEKICFQKQDHNGYDRASLLPTRRADIQRSRPAFDRTVLR
jgi:hypothetical protein